MIIFVLMVGVFFILFIGGDCEVVDKNVCNVVFWIIFVMFVLFIWMLMNFDGLIVEF